MSIETVKEFFKEQAPDIQIIEHDQSTATVELAAAALGVSEGQIAKTLALGFDGRVALFVLAGNAKLDNQKFKTVFGAKPKMLTPEQAFERTGHPIGGVCPFGLKEPTDIYCDISLRAYEEIYPAAGSLNSAVRLPPERLAELVDAQWVDIGRMSANECEFNRSTQQPG